MVVNRSTDGGLTWGNPVQVAGGGGLDKNWTTCDNTPTSTYYGNCYTEFDNNAAGDLILQPHMCGDDNGVDKATQ